MAIPPVLGYYRYRKYTPIQLCIELLALFFGLDVPLRVALSSTPAYADNFFKTGFQLRFIVLPLHSTE